ncbi:acyltransferase family protein [Leucobacter sp. GX0328]
MPTGTDARTGRVQARPAGSAVRRDVQGLRTIAVGLVLIYHLAPQHLSGGYIGVDIFFVISGFLITGQILGELDRSGRIDLPRFWARRARRLLPAAMVVLIVTVAGVYAFVPTGLTPAFLAQVAAATGYAENWMLAAQAVDYSAAGAAASPVQHYWSLSVEEQFYIVWPLAAVLAIAIAAKLRARSRDRAPGLRVPGPAGVFAALIVVIALLSFGHSIAETAANPSWAYFSTATRAWEFAFGGVLAWLAAARPAWPRALQRIDPRLRMGAVWAGVAGIVVTALVYSDATPFPGATALLPVVSTLLIVAAAEPGGPGSLQPLLASRPMQWLGDASYGIYLWHFPFIVLAPYLLGRPLDFWTGCIVVVATLGAAALSKRYVEDPFRFGPARRWSNRRSLAFAGGGMAVLIGLTLGGFGVAKQDVAAAQQSIAADLRVADRCTGAGALDTGSGCEAVPDLEPTPGIDLVADRPESCLSNVAGDQLLVCEYGAPVGEAERTVALLGDSHAEQWLTPLKRIAERENWHLVVMAKGSCPFTTAERDYVTKPEAQNEKLRADCSSWNDQVIEALEERPEIDTIVTSAKAANRVVSNAEDWQDAAVLGYEERWQQLPGSVRGVVAIADTPQMPEDVLQCVGENGEKAASACAAPATEQPEDDPLLRAAAVSRNVETVDMGQYFRSGEEHPPVLGGVLVYRDSHHISWAYAETLTDALAERLDPAMPELSNAPTAADAPG